MLALFYLFAAISVISALMVVSARSPITVPYTHLTLPTSDLV